MQIFTEAKIVRYRMHRFVTFILASVFLFTPLNAEAAVAPGAAGVLSIVPGLGQAANGNALEGFAWFTTTVGLYFSGSSYARDIGYEVWQYNMYDAYRDAGAKDTSKENVLQNGIAPLNPANLFDPISVGIVGYGVYTSSRGKNIVRQGPSSVLGGAFLFAMVGLGEEGLFRGFLFPAFSHVTNSYTVGAIASSAVFAAFHLGNKDSYYRSATGLTTIFAAGLLLCLQSYLQRFDLRHSIFSHAWFDFTVEYLHIGSTDLRTRETSVPTLHFNYEF